MADIVTTDGERNQGTKELVKIESNPKSQSINFGSIIQSVLSGASTNVETSKFSIEKTEDGIRFDVALSGIIKTGKKD
jgi:hypothetical protein